MNTTYQTVEEVNKQTVQLVFEAFAALDDVAMDLLLAPGYGAHNIPPGCSNDAEGMKESARLMHRGLQDCRNQIDDVIASGDKVVVRYTTRATHSGELFGAPPTGRDVTLTGIEIYRLEDGKVAEFWGEYDASDLFETA